MFSRIGAAAIKKDLVNTIALCDALDNPENKFKSIHIAGTNGKGSTSHMLAAILQEAGYKTGLYTSPHLKDFRERIRINGKMISEDEVVRFVELYKYLSDTIEPSFFEWTVGLCFHYFAQQKIDIAVIETGLGGRLDSTNIINPLVSVITNIGYDHTDLLGDTLEKIAYEKAGIIKQKTPVVIGETHPETQQVFIEKAKNENAPITFADKKIELTNMHFSPDGMYFDCIGNDFQFTNLHCELGGLYQEHNVKTVLNTVLELRAKGFIITDEHIHSGLHQVKQLTGLLGRWHKLANQPLTICDTAHNVNGLEYVMQQLQQLSYQKLHMVVGMVKDKDITKMLSMLPKSATYYFCQASIPRALPTNELMEQAKAFGLKGNACGTVKEAYHQAQQTASNEDVIFIGGSTFVVAEVV